MKRQQKSPPIINAVDKALNLLEQFQADYSDFSLSDMVRRLSLSKNNVYRLLATLEFRSFRS